VKIVSWSAEKDDGKGVGEISYAIESLLNGKKSLVNKKLVRFKELYGKLKSDNARGLFPPGSATYPLAELNDVAMKPRYDPIAFFTVLSISSYSHLLCPPSFLSHWVHLQALVILCC